MLGRARDIARRGRPYAPGGLVVLGYHRIDSGGGGLAVPAVEFREHLDWIAGWRVVGLDKVEYSPAGQRPHVAITFDDGYLSVAEEAWPALRERGWPATLYVVAKALLDPRPFEWDSGVANGRARLVDSALVKDLAADGMAIGSHSCTHRYLPGLLLDEVRSEVTDSRRIIEDVIGQEVRSFSYPMGGWNAALRDTVRDAGYSTAVTCERGRNVPGANPLALRRHIIEPRPVSFARMVDGSYDLLGPVDRRRERRRQAECVR